MKAVAIGLVIFTLFVMRPLLPARVNATQPFSFAFSGDLGSLESGTNGGNSLSRLRTANPTFFIALGDLEYDAYDSNPIPEQTWCSKFKDSNNGCSNVLIVAGNHDTGEATPKSNLDRLIQYCPFPLTVGITGTYGKEYYFDYPQTNPLSRIILISPRIANITGECNATRFPGITSCSTSSSSCTTLENEQVGKCYWQYKKDDTHYNWVKNAIDTARSSGIQWVIVGSHKNCITVGTQTCVYRNNSNNLPELFNLLVEKRVDLILQAHDHNYQHIKQLAITTNCKTSGGVPGFELTTTSKGQEVIYDADCVVDAPPYDSGRGTIEIIAGAFGEALGSIDTSDIEINYVVSSMGASNSNHGFVTLTIGESSISSATDMKKDVGSPDFSDSFTITKGYNGAGDFTLAPNATSVTVNYQNWAETGLPVVQITLTSTNNFMGIVHMSASPNYPDPSQGPLLIFNPVDASVPVGGSTNVILSFFICQRTPGGWYTFTVAGTSSDLSHSFQLRVRITGTNPNAPCPLSPGGG